LVSFSGNSTKISDVSKYSALRKTYGAGRKINWRPTGSAYKTFQGNPWEYESEIKGHTGLCDERYLRSRAEGY
jgi:hypothetical protein